MPATISRTAQAIKYFAEQQQRAGEHTGLPRARLVKLLYLSDLLAREYLGQPLTDLEYIRYKYGPWDRAVLDAIAELVDRDLVRQKNEWDFDNVTKLVIDLGQRIALEFTPAETEILKYVAAAYMAMPLQELLYDVVYPSPPMKDARMSTRLPMEVVDNHGREVVGFDLNEILTAENEIDSGRFSTSLG